MSWILMIIFGLIAIISVIGTFQAIKDKNLLSVAMHGAAALVLGWFVIMSLLNSAYPAVISH
jgi:heme A synthase